MKPPFFYSIILFFCCLAVSASLSAQEATTTSHEIGTRFSGLNNFGFIYKKSKNDKRFLRIRAASTDLGITGNSVDVSGFDVGASFAIGLENRRRIAEEFHFIHGPELAFSFAYDQRTLPASSGERTTSSTIFSPRIGYILGFQYDVSDRFYVSIEAIPGLSYAYQIDEDDTALGVERRTGSTFDLGFNSNAVALSVVYRF